MRSKYILSVTALALAGALSAFPALAQNYPTGRAANDGGMQAEPTGAPQYNGAGQVVASPAGETGGGGSSCATRFHSYDPSTGTYMGADGRRHSCQ